MHEVALGRVLAAAKTGNSIAASIAIMAMTTSSSISVKPLHPDVLDPHFIVLILSYQCISTPQVPIPLR